MRTKLSLALLLVATVAFAADSPRIITTVAGTGQSADGGDAGPALKTNVGDPFGVEIGPDGALYICEVRNHRVRKLDQKTGELTTVAGSGTVGYAGDGGPATKAKLNEPYEVRFDKAGNMLFVEMKNHLVRKVDAKTGAISTVAGTGKAGFGGDGGPATAAQLSSPHSIALDANDNLYIADIANHRIRRVDAKSGIITTIAGTGEKVQPAAGLAAGKPMIGPRALFIQDGILWIALREGHSVWKLDMASGMLAHVAGTGKKGFTGDGGPAAQATFDGPKGIVTSADGKTVYVVDTENHAIRAIDLTSGIISTVAGRGPKQAGSAGDGGPATEATMNRPHGICVGPQGEVFVGDTLSHRVRKF
jgi:DNA-binding beta-propeller fold protein YncE